MKFLCAVLSAVVFAGCGRISATETNRPAVVVEYFQQDSARVIARWSRPCDAKGCADGYRIQWAAGALTVPRTRTVAVDTLRVARPAIGDSIAVSVAVTSLRRGIAGATRTATAIVRNPDAPPPAVDSLRADTTAAMAAELDSFPIIVARDTLGRSAGVFAVGEGTVLCGLSRNRYTGEVRLFIPADAPEGADAYLAAVCERARIGFLFERDG